MVGEWLSSAAILLLSVATLYLGWQEGKTAYAAAGRAYREHWRHTALLLLSGAAAFAAAMLLPLPVLLRFVGMMSGPVAWSWVTLRQQQGWWDLSDEYAAIREHNRKYPSQQWIAAGCMVGIWVIVSAALVLIPLLSGSDYWQWPWEAR